MIPAYMTFAMPSINYRSAEVEIINLVVDSINELFLKLVEKVFEETHSYFKERDYTIKDKRVYVYQSNKVTIEDICRSIFEDATTGLCNDAFSCYYFNNIEWVSLECSYKEFDEEFEKLYNSMFNIKIQEQKKIRE